MSERGHWVDDRTGERVTATFVVKELRRDGMMTWESSRRRVVAKKPCRAFGRLYQFRKPGWDSK